MQLSVVIPVKNEAENIGPLVEEIHRALDPVVDFEIVYVDDGSTDATAARIIALQEGGDTRLRLLRHERSCGQSTAVRSGVKAARAPWIATLDGDGQNDPADIPALWRLACETRDETGLLLAGWRARRRDSRIKRVSSRIANGFRAWMLRDATPDTGCGLKLFSRALFLELPYFDHMHRFLPALVIRAGGRVVSVRVNHRPRERGKSNYGTLDRLFVGVVDLFGVAWLQRRRKAAGDRRDPPGMNARRAAGLAALIAALIGGAALWRWRSLFAPEELRALLAAHRWAPLGYLALHVVASLIFVPRLVLALAAGVIFGLGWGTFWATLGGVLGGYAGFLLARLIGHALPGLDPGDRVASLLRRAERGGWRAVWMIRLLPLPASAVNYAFGLTRIGWLAYGIGTGLGVLPSTIMAAGLGAAGRHAIGGETGQLLVPLIVGIAGLGLSMLIPRLPFFRRRQPVI